MTLGLDAWIAIAMIGLPLIAKAAMDISAAAASRKHLALANIVGMAGRQAGTIARALAALPAGTSGKGLEKSLITAATDAVLTEMSGSVGKVGADQAKVAAIVQGELDKLLAVAATAPAVPLAERIQQTPPVPRIPVVSPARP